MSKPVPLLAVMLLSACGQNLAPSKDQDCSFTLDPDRIYPQVNDPAAPTIAELRARGLDELDADLEWLTCGAGDYSAHGQHNHAYFMGHRRNPEGRIELSDYQFTCPNPEEAIPKEQLRCGPFVGFSKPYAKYKGLKY